MFGMQNPIDGINFLIHLRDVHVFSNKDEGKGVRVCYIFHAFEGTNYTDLVVFELLS